MTFVAQLLPDAEQAQLLSEALEVMRGAKPQRQLTDEEDAAVLQLHLKLITDMRKKSR